ncbi:hypothetical protein [Epilithonimonas sp. UC225_85]|uniref:hypothetical protein n=1 Tax=Epilithonimonas sp. UC225_85 TaxID=3350167 RepID=UPI0036D3170A
MNKNKFNEFIEKYNVKEEIVKSFENLLKLNSVEDLNIKNKNISIDVQKIEYKKTDFNSHSFATPVKDIQKVIGAFTLVFNDKAEITDEFFIIN